MANTKINFTKEHQERLNQLAGEALVSGTMFKGSSVGTEHTIYDLFHNCNINTLSRMFANLKKEVAAIDDLDEWSLTDYQVDKQKRLNKQKELVSLIIGFKRFEEQRKSDREAYRALQAKIQNLKDAAKTPKEQIEELEKELAGYDPEIIA